MLVVLAAATAQGVGPTTGNVNGDRQPFLEMLQACEELENAAFVVVRDDPLTAPTALALAQSLGGARTCLRELEDALLTALGNDPDPSLERALKEVRAAIKFDGKVIDGMLGADAAALARDSFRRRHRLKLSDALAAKSVARFYLQQITTTRKTAATHDAYRAGSAYDAYALGFETANEGKPLTKLGWSANLTGLKVKPIGEGPATTNRVLTFAGKKRGVPGTGGFDIRRPLAPPFDVDATIGIQSAAPPAVDVLTGGFACLQIFDTAATPTFRFFACARPFTSPAGFQVFTSVNGATLGQTFVPGLAPLDLRIEVSLDTVRALVKPRGAEPASFTAIDPPSGAGAGIPSFYGAIGVNGLPKADAAAWWFDDLGFVAATR